MSTEQSLESSDSSGFWSQLPLELAERIVGHLEPNEVACSLRLVSKATAAQFRGPRHTTIRLSQPVPPDAFAQRWLAPGATRGLNLKQRRKLLCLTAASGSVPNLEVAVRAVSCFPKSDTFEAATAAGSLDACQWLHRQGCPMTLFALLDGPCHGGDVLSVAAGGGHMHVCEWLLTLDDFTWNWGAEAAAAEGGHVDLMEWLMYRELQPLYACQPDDMERMKRLAVAVASGCSLPTLQRLWPDWAELLHGGCKAEVLAAAAGSPTPDWAAKVEWLEGQGCLRTVEAAAKAVARPDALERLTWLQGRGYRISASAPKAAAKNGHTAVLDYLLTECLRDLPGSLMEARCAAEGGHLPALQVLHAAGWPVTDPWVSGAAARGGHLHVVAWLVEAAGVVLNAELFAAAAKSGSVELMAWVRQRGCEWDAEAFSSAADSGCEEALEWLAAQGCPVPEDGGPYKAVLHSDPPMLRCLRRLDVPWGGTSKYVVKEVCYVLPATLRWLLEAGCPLDADAEAEAQAALAEAAPCAAAEAEENLQLLRRHQAQRLGQPAVLEA